MVRAGIGWGCWPPMEVVMFPSLAELLRELAPCFCHLSIFCMAAPELNLCGLPLYHFRHLCIFLLLRVPELNIVLQVGSHKGRTGGKRPWSSLTLNVSKNLCPMAFWILEHVVLTV